MGKEQTKRAKDDDRMKTLFIESGKLTTDIHKNHVVVWLDKPITTGRFQTKHKNKSNKPSKRDD